VEAVLAAQKSETQRRSVRSRIGNVSLVMRLLGVASVHALL